MAKSGHTGRLSVRGEEGVAWKISDFAPKHCLLENRRLSRACDYVTLYLSAERTCLDDIQVAWHWDSVSSRTIEGIIREVTDNFQKARTRAPLEFMFSEQLLEAQIHKERFPISRSLETAQPICSHLASIENAFNLFKSKLVIRAYKSCDRILVALANESPPKEFTPCL